MLRLCSKAVVLMTLYLLVFVGVMMAEPLAKSGKVAFHSGWKGEGVMTKISDERMYWQGSYWGVSFNDAGKGIFHGAVLHCPAVTDIHNKMLRTKGLCTVLDAEGDTIFGDWTGQGSVGGEFAGRLTMTGGTGKYEGIEGGWDFQCQFIGAHDQGTCRQQATYKLP
jgi:hypothetical protein